MPDSWKCPACGFQNTMTQFQQRYSGWAVVGLPEEQRNVNCGRCYRTVALQDLLQGKYDVGKLFLTPEQEKKNNLVGCASLIAGAVATLIAYQFFGVIVSLIIGFITFFVLFVITTEILSSVEKKGAGPAPPTGVMQPPQEVAEVEPVAWESMPRFGKTLQEELAESLPNRGAWLSEQLEVPPEIIITVSYEQIADKACVWNCPTLYVVEDKACCFLKTNTLSEDETAILSDNIAQDKMRFTATFNAARTFPVVALLFHVPTTECRKLEAVPNLAQANVRDFLDLLLKRGSGVFYFFVGTPPHLLAKGNFTVESIDDLRRCLDQAATHFRRISPNQLNYLAAAEEYFRTTCL